MAWRPASLHDYAGQQFNSAIYRVSASYWKLNVQVAQDILLYSIPALQTTTSPDCQLSLFELLSETWQLHPQLQEQLRGPLLTLLGFP